MTWGISVRQRRLAAALLAVCALVLTAPARTLAAPPPWPGFPIIEYQDRDPAQLATLKRIGVTAGRVLAVRHGDPREMIAADAPLRTAGLGCYVENIATDFYSSYHRWTPGRAVNWRFVAAQKAYRADPSSLAPLMRVPSLSDPAWLARIEKRLAAHVRVMRPYHPLWYDLADEAGIADLAAFWDFDFSPPSLAAFRTWLHGQYGSLSALNAEWGTHFSRWAAVRPWTTRQAMAAPSGNIAPWADFKAFMDVAFADAVRAGTDAVHRADPNARAALEGAQVPGWGGYDYALLAPSVDVMEVYDADQNMALLRAFNPHVLPVVTAFGAGDAALHRLWREVLDGARAIVIWDADPSVITRGAKLTLRGREYVRIFAALHGAAGRALAASTPVYDPVAIVYSPASFRVAWMIENRPRGDAWMHGSSEADAQGVATRTALNEYAEDLRHMGLRPQFIDDAQLGAGPPKDVRLLILPHQAALSNAELRSLLTFARNGGVIVTDAAFGLTDLHGRFRAHPPSGIAARRVAADDRAGLEAALAAAHVTPRFRTDAADVVVSVSRNGSDWLVAVQRDFTARAVPEDVSLTLPEAMHATEMISGEQLPAGRTLHLRLGVVTPTLLVLAPAGREVR